MDPHEAERRARAAMRSRSMTLQKGRLGEQERDFPPVCGAEALTLVTHLSRESWLETGRDLPSYSRAETPYRFVRELQKGAPKPRANAA